MSFSNKKALKYGLILIQNSSGLYGVQNTDTGESVLGTKYKELRFMESTRRLYCNNTRK